MAGLVAVGEAARLVLGVVTGSGEAKVSVNLLSLLNPIISPTRTSLTTLILGDECSEVSPFFSSSFPRTSFNLGLVVGATINRADANAATDSGPAMGFPVLPNLVNDSGMKLLALSAGCEANPRGRILALDEGEERRVGKVNLPGVISPKLPLSLSLSEAAVMAADGDD